MRDVPTGFPGLDTLTGGLQAADLVIVVIPSSRITQSLALRMALHVATTNPQGVGLLCLDMNKHHATQRLLAMRTGIDLHRLRTGLITDVERPLVSDAARTLSKAHLWIDDRAGPTCAHLRHRAQQLVERHGIVLLVIDNIHLLQASAQRTPQRFHLQEMGEIGLRLKALAQELRIPIVVEAPLLHALEHHHGRRLRSRDARPDQEQTVDQVLFLSRDVDVEAAADSSSKITIIIAGRRRGEGDESSYFIQVR